MRLKIKKIKKYQMKKSSDEIKRGEAEAIRRKLEQIK